MACGRFPAGDVELAAARRAGTDKDRVVVLTEQFFQAVDALATTELDAEIEDVTGFLVDHRIRQAELWDLRAHHAAGLRVLVEHDAVVTERGEVARYRQRSGDGADDRDALAVFRPYARQTS